MPSRVGALEREHLLMAPPARAPAAAPAAVAEPSVPTPATESSAAAAQSSSPSSTLSPAACAPDREPEVEMTNPVPDRKRGHSAVDPSSPAAAEDDRGPMVIGSICHSLCYRSTCLCIVMATAEQMQEAFQQQQHELQVLTGTCGGDGDTAAIRNSPSSSSRARKKQA